MPVKYFALDFETSGFDAHYGDEVISFAFMLLDESLFCVKKGQWFVRPSTPALVSKEAADVNGYSEELWAERNAMSQDEFFEKLEELWVTHGMERCLPLGQNTAFDIAFIDARAKKHPAFAQAYKQALSYHFVDLISLMVPLDQAHKITDARYKLGEACDRFGVTLTSAHDSLADLEATVGVYMALVALLKTSERPPKPPAPSWIEKTQRGYRMRFGKYKGAYLDDVDAGYIRWAVLNVTLRHDEKLILEAAYASALG